MTEGEWDGCTDPLPMLRSLAAAAGGEWPTADGGQPPLSSPQRLRKEDPDAGATRNTESPGSSWPGPRLTYSLSLAR
jgi:hypothetical protein